jgi:hypothetical protein
MEVMGTDWPNWRCEHANDMEELEYAFESSCREHMIHHWRADVERTMDAHEDGCVKWGYKPNKDWHRKTWFRKDWYHWDCEHASYMRRLELQFIWLAERERNRWKEEVLKIRKDHENELSRK